MTVPAEGPSSLLDWATGLVADPALRSRFAAEPRAVLDEQGLTEVPPADLHHSLPLVTDSVAARTGIDVDATGVGAIAIRLPGEGAVDALARQFAAATDTVAAGDPPPGPDLDLDLVLDDVGSVPDHATPLESIEDDLGGEDTDVDDSPTSDHDHSTEGIPMTAVPQPESDTFSTPEEFATDPDTQAANRQVFLEQKAAFNHFPSADAFLADAQMADDAFLSLYSDYDARNDYSVEDYSEHRVSHETHLVDDPDYTYPAEASTSAADPLGVGDTDLDDLDGDTDPGGSAGSGSGGGGVGESEVPRWLSHDEQGRWYDNGNRSDIVESAPNPTEAPGTPQGWHTLTLEAQSHGFPDAQAYLADPQFAAPEFRQDIAWEPGNRGAAYGELQAYFDAADTAGVSPADYGAANTYTPEQIDAAYAADDSSDTGQDTDLDGFGESASADGDTDVPHGDDPFSDMLQAGGQGTGIPTTPGGDTDLDGFGSGSDPAGDTSFGAASGGGESFGDGDVDSSGGAGDFGSSTDSGPSDDSSGSDSSSSSDSPEDGGLGDDSGSGHTDFSDHADSSDSSDSSDGGGSDDAGDDGGSADSGGGGESFG